MSKAICNKKSGKFLFTMDVDEDITIVQYWPIRLKIHNTGRLCFTLNRVVCDNNMKQ